MKYIAKINKATGFIQFLGEPPGNLRLSDATVERFSEIVPTGRYRYPAFRTLRFLFGEKGRVSDWTRRWRCHWKATILMGPLTGVTRASSDRNELIRWETNVWKTGGAS